MRAEERPCPANRAVYMRATTAHLEANVGRVKEGRGRALIRRVRNTCGTRSCAWSGILLFATKARNQGYSWTAGLLLCDGGDAAPGNSRQCKTTVQLRCIGFLRNTRVRVLASTYLNYTHREGRTLRNAANERHLVLSATAAVTQVVSVRLSTSSRRLVIY